MARQSFGDVFGAPGLVFPRNNWRGPSGRVRVAPSSFARVRYSPIALAKVMINGACPSPSISRMRRVGERLQPAASPAVLTLPRLMQRTDGWAPGRLAAD
jgi:hypothetical protein